MTKFFDFSHLRGDIFGGLTAGVVALPLALAFGEASGARREYRKLEGGGRLAFAGEASQEAMMTMNAALDSGRRAAVQLLAGGAIGGRTASKL